MLANPARVRWALRSAPLVRAVLPKSLVEALPNAQSTESNVEWPAIRHARRVLILEGCVQAATRPQIDAAAARLLDRYSISLVRASGGGCCGAAAHHLGRPDEARARMKRNIDAWWPHIEQGAEAVAATSSACSLMLRDYGRLLDGDPVYGEKAAKISSLVHELTDLLAEVSPTANAKRARIAFHAPCSLQHGLRQHAAVERLLTAHGFELVPIADSHICCGAAGAYTVFQPQISRRLRDEKVRALEGSTPEIIATANIGCQIHLEKGTSIPVRHWVELLEQAG